MTNLSDLEIINIESDNGFFWVEFENGKSLQCCTDTKEDDLGVITISESDNGFMDGMSGDCNEWAVVDGEWGHINDFLIKEAREYGIDVV